MPAEPGPHACCCPPATDSSTQLHGQQGLRPPLQQPALPPYVLHFVIYVPPAEERPMRVLLPDGSPSPTNGFTTQSWGGVHVLEHGGELERAPDVDVPGVDPLMPPRRDVLSGDAALHVAAVALTQLRALLGIELHGAVSAAAAQKGNCSSSGNGKGTGSGSGSGSGTSTGCGCGRGSISVRVLPSRTSGFSSWEVDALARQLSGHHVRKAAAVLGSLSRLVRACMPD